MILVNEPQPDILNHWTNQPAPSSGERCLSAEEIQKIAEGFTEADSPDPAVARAAVLKELELRDQQHRAALARKGSLNGRTKLDEWDVAVMRSMHKVWGLSVAELARRWSMPRETVRDIIKRRSWTHI